MKPETLEILVRFGKLLKSELIMVKGQSLYGTDMNFTYLTEVSYTEPDLWELEGKVFETSNFTLLIEQKENLEKFNQLINIVNTNNIIPPTVTIDSLQDNPQFQEIISRKAYEGVFLLKVDNYLLSINKSLVPINKSDKLNLLIRDMGNKFQGQFIIKKGKNIINKYFMYLKL